MEVAQSQRVPVKPAGCVGKQSIKIYDRRLRQGVGFLSNNTKVNINNIYVNYSLHIALILIKFVSIIKTILNNSYI